VTASSTPFQAMTNTPIVIPPTYTPTATFTPSATNTPIPTDTPVPTETPVPTLTPVLEWNSGGQVTAPILLYHHVSDAGNGNRYYVTLNDFRSQMQALRDWGYSTITPSDLVDVLINGGELPNRPVIITFDDGNIDVYQNAFPIMHEMGFVGAFYIVANRLESNYFVNADQLKEMVADGWEIGSHGMTHTTLTSDYSIAHYEMVESRVILQEATGTAVDTFAYAYGLTDSFITGKVSEYGYRAGMGLGRSWEHSLGTLFYLSRIEVQGDYSFSTFTALLPWSGN
jgi:peptidoglycan/xylan/chitin deacetylase (PgdA/CDA1 family)